MEHKKTLQKNSDDIYIYIYIYIYKQISPTNKDLVTILFRFPLSSDPEEEGVVF